MEIGITRIIRTRKSWQTMKSFIAGYGIPVIIALCILLTMPAAAADWTPDGFTSRHTFHVNGTPAALTNYQIKLVLHNESGTDYVEHIFLPAIVQPDFRDVRFATADGISLNYWMETPAGLKSAVFWVNIPVIPQGAENSIAVTIFSGNASVESEADGDATFPLFDDFDGTSLNRDKWSVSSGTPVIGDSQLSIADPTTIFSSMQFSNNASLRFYGKLTNTKKISFGDPTTTTFSSVQTSAGKIGLFTRAGGSAKNTLYGSTPAAATTIEVLWNSTKSALAIGDGSQKLGQLNPVGTLPVSLISTNNAGSATIDWLLVRQLADTEPAIYTSVPAPSANFSAAVTTGDAPFTVSFTDTSTNNPTSWQWDFNNDLVIDTIQQSPTYTYSIPGNYTVNLTVTNAGGRNSLVKTEFITVTAPTAATADYTADTTSGIAPLEIQFTGQPVGIVTAWAWDFDNDGIIDSTIQNPTHVYLSPGNYTVNLTVTNAGGSNSVLKTDYIQVSGVHPVADFITDITSGNAALTVQFRDNSTGSITNWIWDFGDGSLVNATLKNPVHTYAVAGNYTVNLTISGPMGSNTTIRMDLIRAASNIDLAVTDVNPLLFAHYPKNPVNATIRNQGTEKSTAFNVTFSVESNTTSIRVPALAAGMATTISITDPVERITGSSVPVTVRVDPDVSIHDTNAANNEMSTSGTVIINGYTGHRWSDGQDLTTRNYFRINGDTITSLGNSVYGSDTVSWTSGDLPIPTSATVKDARLYVPYCWDQPGNMLQTTTMTFNGIVVPHESHLREQKGWGTYSDQAYGIFIFNVTDQFSKDGNTASFAHAYAPVRGMTLVVTYEDASASEKQIFINEGFDMLFASSQYYTTPETATAYAPFTGTDIDLGNIKSASVTTSVSRGSGWGTMLFNGSSYPNYWLPGAGEVGMQTTDITPYLSATNNTALLRCDETNKGIEAYLAILKVEYKGSGETAPVATFTSSATTGTAPFTAQFTDASTNTPTSWLWDFGDGDSTNATKQNPVHTYVKAGNYTVNLTATNANGSNSKVLSEYIAVTGSSSGGDAPVANFNVVLDSDGKMPHGLAPVTVSFRDASTGTIGTYLWEYRNYNETAWTAFGAGSKNPADIVFSTPGTYDVRLTVTGSGGSTNKTIRHAFTAGKLHDSLATIANGTVSGDLYINSRSPWDAKTITYSYELPASGSNIQWARVFVNDYSGSGVNNNPLRMTTEFDADGDGTFETVLGAEDCDIQSESNTNSPDSQPYAYPVNDHVTKVFSDYEAWYDVTGLITSTTPKIRVTSSNIGAPVGPDSGYDGRLKAVTLIIAYNDGDSDQVKYIVNHGNDWMTGSSSTSFDAGDFAAGWSNATLTEVAYSSSDATYTFNGGSITPATLGTNSYYKYNTFNVTNTLTPAAANTFGFTNTGTASFKICLAALKARYPGSSAIAPVAAFTATATSGTVPLTVQFTDTSIGTPTSWLWDFGDGNATNATVQSPVHTYLSAGTYTVNLTATNAAGSNSALQAGYITVTPASGGAPVANFTASQMTGLAPLSVAFADTSVNAPAAWKWEFRPSGTDGTWATFSADRTPAYSFGTGAYDIRLTVTNEAGSDTITRTQYLSVSAGSDRLETVQNGTVSGDLYVGAFGGYSSGTQYVTNTFSPTFAIPANTGIRWARLYTVVMASGQDNRTGTATVKFDGNGDGIFETALGTETLATAGTSAADVYPVNDHVSRQYSDYLLWYNVTGLISAQNPAAQVVATPVASNFDARIKTVTLVVAYDDGDTDTVRYWVNDGHDYLASNSGGASTTFATGSVPQGWTSARLRNVMLSSKDAAYLLNGAVLTGANSTVFFGANSWDVSSSIVSGADSSLVYTPNGGSYKTILATLTIRHPAATVLAPVAGFTATTTSGTAPFTVQFTDASTNTPTSWLWDFGDGNATNATVQHPVHTYLNAGTYTVNLTATNAAGSSSKAEAGYVTVTTAGPGAPPAAAFVTNVQAGPAPLDVQFTDTTTTNPTAWAWDFNNDGTIDSAEQSPTYHYTKAGIYTVNLTVTNASGTSSVSRKNVIAVSAGPDRLETVKSGTVSGDLFMGAYQPVAFTSQTSKGVNTAEQTFALPAYTTIRWARLYTVVYGSSGDNRAGTATVTFDGNGDGTYETALGTESLGIPSTSSSEVFVVNDHVSKQYTDYLMEYDVTDKITSQNPKAKVVAAPVDTNFDARIKTLTLVVAYDDGDSDTVQYWVNDGHDYQTKSDGAVTTTFATGALPSGFKSATLRNIGLSSQDAIYGFNGNTLVRQGNNAVFFATNTWDVSGNLTTGADSTFTYIHNSTSTFKTNLATLAVKYTNGGSPSSAPVAAFAASATSGTAPFTVQFTDASTNTPTSWLWDFGDGNATNATLQNPVHTYANSGTYTVNLTATNTAGSNRTTLAGYITVGSGGSATSDLSITGTIKTVPNGTVFAREPNSVQVSGIRNTGTETLSNIRVALYASDVSGTVPVNTTTIATLAGSGTKTLTLTDPTLRDREGGPVTYTIAVDPENLITETNETNNRLAGVAFPVRYNGYKGKGIYWEGGSNITTRHTFDLNGDVVYFTQPDTAYRGVGWSSRTETWSGADLPVPAGATVRKAILYISYNWDQTPGGFPVMTAVFNGKALAPGTPYTDKSNFGGWGDYEYGLYAVDVTDSFSPSGNSLVITPGSENKNAFYPSTLVVVYSDPSASRKQIFINEECDELGVSESTYATTPDEAIAYAPFTGMAIDPASVRTATLHSFAGSAGADEGNLIFNGENIASSAWQGNPNTANASEFDVTAFLKTTGNIAGIQATNSGGMAALQQILVVETAPSAPSAAFSADTLSGPVPLTVQFTDASIGGASGWTWNFGDDDDTNATVPNPVHTYAHAGTYTVKLTVTNAQGSNTSSLKDYITATLGAAVANFTANKTSGDTPLSVQFTDLSTGSPSSWTWDFGDSGTSAEKNPVHTYNAAGTYTVKLTAANPSGSSTKSRSGYISVTAKAVTEKEFNLAGVETTTNGGAQNVTINTTQVAVNTTGSVVTLSGVGNGWASMDLVMDGTPEIGASTINGTIAGVRAVGQNISVPIPDVGSPKVHVELSLDELPPGGSLITETITREPDASATSSFTLAASNDGKQISEIAYTINFNKTGLANAGDGGIINNATIYFSVSPAWVAAHGGTGKIVIMRRNDAGVTTFLQTTYLGTDSDGNDLFSAYSPDGLSVFVLAAVAPVSTSAPTPTATITTAATTSPTSSGGSTSGGDSSPSGAGSSSTSKSSASEKQKGKVYDYSQSAPPQSAAAFQTTAVSRKGRVSVTPLVAEESASMPNARASWSAEIVSDPEGGGKIQTSLITAIPENVIASYRAVLAGQGLDVSSVAYAMNIEKGSTIGATKDAKIEMTGSQKWVYDNGGISQVRILRIGDDGTAELLKTSFSGYDHETKYLTFQADSANGLCTFTLLAVKAATPGSTAAGTTVNGQQQAPAQQAPAALPDATRAPGFDALIVLTGIGAAAFAVARRR